MADENKSSGANRPVIIGLIALLSIGGLVSAPTVSECLNDEAGFGACVGAKFQGTSTSSTDGALVADATDVNAADMDVDDEPEAAPIESQDQSSDPAADNSDAGETSDTSETESPLIDARVEPDGFAVLLGSTEPNTEINFFANGEPLGSTTTDDIGDWVFIPDAPLDAGGVALTTDLATQLDLPEDAEDALAVVIAEDRESAPLVVASRTDEISTTLQELTGRETLDIVEDIANMESAADEDLVVAENNSDQTDASTEATETTETTDAAPDQPATEEDLVVANVEPEPVAADETEQASTTENVGDDQEQATEDLVVASIDAVEIDGSSNFIAGAGEEGTTVNLFVDDELVGQSVVEGGRWLVEAEDALQADTQRIRAEFADAEGQPLDEKAEVNFVIAQADAAAFEAESLILSGEALAPAVLPTEAPAVPAPDVAVAAVVDQAEAATDEVVSAVSDEVTLSGEALAPAILPTEAPAVPAPDVAVAAVVDQAEAATDEMVSAATDEVTLSGEALAPAVLPTEAPAVPAPDVAVAAVVDEVEVATDEMVSAATDEVTLSGEALAPAVLPTEAPAVPAPDVAVAAMVDQAEAATEEIVSAVSDEVTLSGEALAPAILPTEAPAVPAPDVAVAAVVDEADDGAAETIESAPVPGLSQDEDAELPTLTVVAVGEPDQNRFASGKVIIRSGDNLWSISRRVYGQGIDYVHIFAANRDVIGDPNLIFPGQIFSLPQSEQQ